MHRLLLILLILSPSCAYRIGGGLTAGILDETQGEGRSSGLTGTADQLLERALLVELGHQLGQGLTSGAADITDEQRARMEATIEGLLDVAAKKSGKGLRTEVSPELRAMVRDDIIRTFAEGLRGELGDSLENTVDRVVTRAVISLRDNLADEETRYIVSDLLRDSIYYAMREGQATPGVGETLELTLQENMLTPIEGTLRGLEARLEQQARRTENTLKGIITALVLVSSVFFMLWLIRNRQVRHLQAENVQKERGLKNVDAALELLDDNTRHAVMAKLEEYRAVEQREQHIAPTPEPAPRRGDDYLR